MNKVSRIQNSEFRIGNSRFVLWPALLAVVLAAGCASPKAAQFTDADWVSHSTTGRGAYERGDYARAAEAYGRAERRARALDDADALAVAAVNRATCLLAAGQAAEAIARVDEALKLEPSPTLKAQALLAKSGAELARENPAAATKALSDGMSAKDWNRLPESLRAEQAALRAQIAVAEKKPAEALARQDEAATLWKKADRLPEMARALAAAGRQAQAADDLAGACDRFYRAARSLWAQGFQPEAIRILEEGVKAAERLEDEAVAKKMAALFVTFKDEQRLEK